MTNPIDNLQTCFVPESRVQSPESLIQVTMANEPLSEPLLLVVELIDVPCLAAQPVLQVSTCTGREERPCWTPKRRTLHLGGRLLKKFMRPAAVQELILTVFEEEGWPERIDDPLPLQPATPPSHRLRNAVRSLNRGLNSNDICFHADGTGTGITWALRARVSK